ncbi:hypothetical protein [Deinococcus malanensis]|nr:hypothetical protein [Deinococcus malanensis]
MMVRGLWVSLLLGGGSMAAAPDHGQCGYGVTITASYVIFEKTRVPTGGIPYACALVRRDTVTGLVEVEHHVFNAMEDVTRLFFKPRIGLIWRTNAHLIGATKHDYLFAADNSGEPLHEARVYHIHKGTLARRTTRLRLQARPGCGEIEFVGQNTAFRPPYHVQVSRVDGCGLFTKTIPLR